MYPPHPNAKNKTPKDYNLGEKIRAAAQFMLDNGIATENEIDAIVTWSQERNLKFSIDYLHHYVHNMYVSPAPSDLKAHWDTIQHFIEYLWA